MRFLILLLLAYAPLASAADRITGRTFATRSEVIAPHAMAATSHPLATQIALDVMNIGNLVNKDWGLIDDYGFFSTRRVANYAGIDPATGKYVYNFTGTTDNPQIQENNNDKGNTGASRWSAMLSFKYKF